MDECTVVDTTDTTIACVSKDPQCCLGNRVYWHCYHEDINEYKLHVCSCIQSCQMTPLHKVNTEILKSTSATNGHSYQNWSSQTLPNYFFESCQAQIVLLHVPICSINVLKKAILCSDLSLNNCISICCHWSGSISEELKSAKRHTSIVYRIGQFKTSVEGKHKPSASWTDSICCISISRVSFHGKLWEVYDGSKW